MGIGGRGVGNAPGTDGCDSVGGRVGRSDRGGRDGIEPPISLGTVVSAGISVAGLSVDGSSGRPSVDGILSESVVLVTGGAQVTTGGHVGTGGHVAGAQVGHAGHVEGVVVSQDDVIDAVCPSFSVG